MKEVTIDDLKPGMITARAVITPSGQLIINKGVELDKKLIARIDFYSIESAWIEETQEEILKKETIAEKTRSDEPDSIKQPQKIPVESAERVEKKVERTEFTKAGNASYSQQIKRSSKFQDFQMAYTMKLLQIKEAMNNLLTATDFNAKEFMTKALDILGSQKLTTIELFDNIHNLRQVDDSIYAHSINVALIARILGTWLKYDRETLDQLTIAGLLHDIGKIKIPEDILNKPGKLSSAEFEIIKMHPTLGYDSVDHLNLDPRVKEAILKHHERCDGSGYPVGIKADEIDDFTMVIAISDVYDAMTAARKYRAPLCPFQVIASFEEEGLQKYKPSIILTFLERIANTYQNNRVLLSDGRQATIVLLNHKRLSKPTVKLDDGTFLDLSTCSEKIISML